MTDEQLLAEWKANRNSHRSVIVADEMMRRLVQRQEAWHAKKPS